jgi:hypothetical protein
MNFFLFNLFLITDHGNNFGGNSVRKDKFTVDLYLNEIRTFLIKINRIVK